MVNKKIYIYTLINPLTDEVFYVGYTYNLKKRLYEHLYSYNLNDNKYKKFVIEKIVEQGLKPLIKVIDECEYLFNDKLKMYEHEILEIFYIKKYKDLGYRLTNLTIGGKNPPISKTKKIVYRFDKNFKLIKKYESITEASIELDVHPTRICAALDQKRKLTCNGFYWSSFDFLSNVKTEMKRHTIPIAQYSLDGVFLCEYNSQNEAERKSGVNAKQINKCLKIKGFDQAGGYMWFYKDKIPFKIEKYNGRTFSRKILVYDLKGNYFGKYNSIREGSKDLNINETSICKNLKGHTSRAGKYIFEYNN